MSNSEKLKRPASHRWAIGFCGFMTAAFVVFVIDVLNGRSGASLGQYWVLMMWLSVGALGLCVLVLGGREHWAYYVASGMLAIWAGGAILALLLFAYHFVAGDPFGTAYFHLAERDKPFVVWQSVGLAGLMKQAVGAGLMVWLFIRFTFGHPSRSYYRFCDTGDHDAGAARRTVHQQATKDPVSSHWRGTFCI